MCGSHKGWNLDPSAVRSIDLRGNQLSLEAICQKEPADRLPMLPGGAKNLKVGRVSQVVLCYCAPAGPCLVQRLQLGLGS